MQIDNFISYLLEIGILDIENKQILLNIYNNIKNKANNEIENEIIKISFFSYIRTLAKEDKKLFELCRRIIFIYNQKGNRSRDNFVIILNQLLMNKFSNIFNDLIIKLNLFSHVNNILKIKNKKNKLNYSNLNNNTDNSDIKIKRNSRPISYQNLRLNTNSSENESIYSNNLNYIINNNNIKSYTYYSPAVNVISKSSKKNYNSPLNNKADNNFYNTISNFYLNTNQNHNIKDFYANNMDFTKKLNDKIITMKLNKIKDENKELTFHPKINKNYKINYNHTENTNNIRLYKNNSKENENTKINSQNAIFNKLYNDGKKKKDFIDKILKEEKNDFKPKINKNYKVSTTFSERMNKSKNKNFSKQNSLNTKIIENKKKLENLKKNELYKIKNSNEKDNKKNTIDFEKMIFTNSSNTQNNNNINNDEKLNENNNNINEKQIFEINEKNPNLNSKIIENKINNIEPKDENNLHFVKSDETNKNNNYNMNKNNNFTDIQSLSDVNSNNFLNNSMISNAKKEEQDENKLHLKENTYESKTLNDLLKINKDNLK